MKRRLGDRVIEIRREDHRSLDDYRSIPIAFVVRERLALSALDGTHGELPALPISAPWIKDYDVVPGNEPERWASKFDVTSWTILAAYAGQRRVGGAIVATDLSAVLPLGGRPTFALLWDLRVAPEARRLGVGRALLAQVELAAQAAALRGIDVETQDINVPACRLYAAAGYSLRAATESYSDAPGETKLVWTKHLHHASIQHPRPVRRTR